MNKPNIVYVREDNTQSRHLAMAIFSFPMLILLSSFIGIPFIFFNAFTIVTAVLTTIAAEIAVVFIALKYTKTLQDWRSYIRLQNFNKKVFAWCIGAGIGIFGLLQLVSIGLNALGIEIGSSDTSVALSEGSAFGQTLVFWLFVPFIVPFIEEVFFRGLITKMAQSGISDKKKGRIWAIVISTIAFGFAHAQGFSTASDLFAVVWTGLIGLLSAILAIKYDSIWPSYGLHLAYNGITVLAVTLLT